MKFLRTISTLTLAFLVLFSSSSFMVGIHWCGGHIQDYALFTKADVCPMEKNFPPCHKPVKNTCCEDQAVVHDGVGFKASFNKISFDQPWQLQPVVPVVLLAEIVPQSLSAIVHYADYDPPTRPVDVTTDLQVFLI